MCFIKNIFLDFTTSLYLLVMKMRFWQTLLTKFENIYPSLCSVTLINKTVKNAKLPKMSENNFVVTPSVTTTIENANLPNFLQYFLKNIFLLFGHGYGVRRGCYILFQSM